MKASINNVRRLLTLMLSIAALGTVATITMQTAFADTPSVVVDPNPLIITSISNKIVLTGAGDGSLPHFDVRLGFQEPPIQDTNVVESGSNTPDGVNGGGTCDLDTTTDDTDAGSYWVLTDGTTADGTYIYLPVEFDFPDTVPAPRVEIPLASGSVTISYFNGATGPASAVWTDQNDGAGVPLQKAMSIDYLTGVPTNTKYVIHYCGYDDATTANDHFSQEKEVQTQNPVAGEIIPINTTALLIAGISSSPMLALSALGFVAGAAFVVLRLQVTRK
jgi:hypothetical protein